MRDDAARRFLKMIGRQPVIFGADELFEEIPRAPRQRAQPRGLAADSRSGRGRSGG
jgi:hypothetical protein